MPIPSRCNLLRHCQNDHIVLAILQFVRPRNGSGARKSNVETHQLEQSRVRFLKSPPIVRSWHDRGGFYRQNKHPKYSSSAIPCSCWPARRLHSEYSYKRLMSTEPFRNYESHDLLRGPRFQHREGFRLHS